MPDRKPSEETEPEKQPRVAGPTDPAEGPAVTDDELGEQAEREVRDTEQTEKE
jgi:hypothetical protein